MKQHAAECDHVAIELLRLARQLEAVADDVGEFLDLAVLIVVRQDDGAALLA